MPRRIKDQSIVIVEDDPHICESLSMFLGEQNKVRTYPSAEDAMAAEGQFQDVRVFILDYKLPGKDGVELFQHFQKSYPAAKFIMITGEMSYDMAENTRKLGLDALMLKPFDFMILEDNISGLIAA